MWAVSCHPWKNIQLISPSRPNTQDIQMNLWGEMCESKGIYSSKLPEGRNRKYVFFIIQKSMMSQEKSSQSSQHAQQLALFLTFGLMAGNPIYSRVWFLHNDFQEATYEQVNNWAINCNNPTSERVYSITSPYMCPAFFAFWSCSDFFSVFVPHDALNLWL